MTPKKNANFAKNYSGELPLYIYDSEYLKNRANFLLNEAKKYDVTVRYALKANPHEEVVRIFNDYGMHFDASSDFEVDHLVRLGVSPAKISLSSQQPARDYAWLDSEGVNLVATSIHQLSLMADTKVKNKIAIRVNPAVGHGGTKKTNTGGLASSFGIWHEYLQDALQLAGSSGIEVNRLHMHVGSGFSAEVWTGVIDVALETIMQMPSVTILDIGGGFKVSRVDGEHEADMKSILAMFYQKLQDFKKQTGRNITLEIEPGTWLVANAGYLLAEVVDIVDTGHMGYTFAKLNTGMNDFLRPTLYGAQHRLEAVDSKSVNMKDYVVVGHNCESGDIITTGVGEPEEIATYSLPELSIGNKLLIMGTGAYCASMRAKGYNSFPDAKEIFI